MKPYSYPNTASVADSILEGEEDEEEFTDALSSELHRGIGPALGVPLDPEGEHQKKTASRKKLDILGYTRFRRVPVAIEVQFGAADCDHAGRLQHYTRYTDARIGVLVADEFPQAARDTLHTGGRQFVGVEMSAYQGEGQPMIDFDLAVIPDGWEEYVNDELEVTYDGSGMFYDRCEMLYHTSQWVDWLSYDSDKYIPRKPNLSGERAYLGDGEDAWLYISLKQNSAEEPEKGFNVRYVRTDTDPADVDIECPDDYHQNHEGKKFKFVRFEEVTGISEVKGKRDWFEETVEQFKEIDQRISG